MHMTTTTTAAIFSSVEVLNEKERQARELRHRLGTGCFLSGSGAFWCILGACFNVGIRRVKVKTESMFPLYKKE